MNIHTNAILNHKIFTPGAHSAGPYLRSDSFRGSYFKYRGEGLRTFLIRFGRGLSGRVLSEVLSGLCMGAGSQILVRFGGAYQASRFVKEC